MQIEERLSQCKLELHPERPKIVYCKDGHGEAFIQNESFVFLGYSFSPRKAQSRSGQHFVSFSPAVSSQAAKKMHREMRSWRFHRHSDKSLEDLARISNAILRGWINYYGRY